MLLVDSSKEVALLAAANYKVHATVGANPQAIASVKCLTETGAGPNLVNKSFLHSTWMGRIERQHFLKMRSANRQPTSLGELIMFHLRIGDVRIQVWFGVVINLPVYVLLDTSFIVQNV